MQKQTMSLSEPESRMTLAKVVKGKINQPFRVVLYGPPGIGKSTFAAGAPSPIFLGAEKGTAQLDVDRFPQPEKWQDVLDAFVALGTQDHSYKTVVIDTLDWVEPMVHRAVLEEDNKGKDASHAVTDIDSMGYGRGYNLALTQWRKLLSFLERISDVKGMNVIMLAHSQIKSFKNPEGNDFDRYEMKLHHKAGGLLQEWADEVFFANYETFTTETKGRVRGISSGTRVIHTVRTAAFDAKNRHDLPDTLPLSWADYSATISKGEPASIEEVKKAIEELLEGATQELTEKASAAIKQAGNSSTKLIYVLNRIRATRKDQ